MTEENRTYITHLKIYDVPWHRLTTAYGRGTEFPAYLTVLEQMHDLSSVKESLYKLTINMEHQSTLWHATPFGMVFLSRILEKALKESGKNPVAHFLAGELLDFFACILQCFHDGDKMEHAEPLPLFSDLLKEEYLWPEEYDEEEDEMRYEEDEVFPDDLFYSFYFKMDSKTSYPSWQDFSEMVPDEDDDDAFGVAWEELTGEDPEDPDDRSQLLGWPDVIQNSMFAECDLVTQGYYLGNGWVKIPKEVRQQAEETACDRWMLLFQLDTVELGDFELMFGDCGHIYFYITKEDLAARRFDRIWLILQCY